MEERREASRDGGAGCPAAPGVERETGISTFMALLGGNSSKEAESLHMI